MSPHPHPRVWAIIQRRRKPESTLNGEYFLDIWPILQCTYSRDWFISVLSTFREQKALNRVNELRQEEHKRMEEKEKKHQTFLRKQIIDDLHDDLIQNVVEPLKMWTGEIVWNRIETISKWYSLCKQTHWFLKMTSAPKPKSTLMTTSLVRSGMRHHSRQSQIGMLFTSESRLWWDVLEPHNRPCLTDPGDQAPTRHTGRKGSRRYLLPSAKSAPQNAGRRTPKK